MFTIQNSCKKTALLLILASLAPAFSGAQELPWPRTFVGQPDFEFLRDEVSQEFRKRKGDEAHKYIATLDTLLEDREIDPFTPTPVTADIGRSKYSKLSFEARLNTSNRKFREVYPDIEVGSGVNVTLNDGTLAQTQLIDDNHARVIASERKIRIEVNADGDVVEALQRENVAQEFDLLFSRDVNVLSTAGLTGGEEGEIQGLPSFTLEDFELPEIEDVDDDELSSLDDFVAFIENILNQAAKEDPSDLKNRDFTRDLAGITLQSIVTQPLQYVIINHKRYNIGDRFTIRLKLDNEPEQDLGAVIDEYIPEKDEVGETLFGHYTAIKKQALEKFAQKPEGEEDEKEKMRDISVLVKDIKRRQVIVSIFDQDYPLKMKFSL